MLPSFHGVWQRSTVFMMEEPASKRSRSSASASAREVGSTAGTGRVSTRGQGILQLRKHTSAPSDVFVMLRDDYIMFGKDVNDNKLEEYWAWVPEDVKAKVTMSQVRRFNTGDAAQNSCHGLIWCEPGGQVKVLVLNARDKAPTNGLFWTSRGEAGAQIAPNHWQTALRAKQRVESAWSLPSDVAYIRVGPDETAWIRVTWTGESSFRTDCARIEAPRDSRRAFPCGSQRADGLRLQSRRDPAQ